MEVLLLVHAPVSQQVFTSSCHNVGNAGQLSHHDYSMECFATWFSFLPIVWL